MNNPTNILYMNKPLVCLTLSELQEFETMVMQSIEVDNDKLILESRAVANKTLALSVYLSTRDIVEKRNTANAVLLNAIRERIDGLTMNQA